MSSTLRSRTVLYLITTDISSVFLKGQLAFLSEAGFRVTVGTKVSDGATPGTFDEGVRLIDIPFVREPSPWRDLVALVAAIRLIRSVRPAVVNASTPKAGLIGMIAARLCRVKVRVYVVRGLRFETMTGRRRRIFVALERVAMLCATHVVFNSRSTLAVAKELGIVGTGVGRVLGAGSGNGLDMARFSHFVPDPGARATFGIPENARVVGFIGRFTKDKGIADLIEAFGHLCATRPDSWLILVGSFESADPLPSSTLAAIHRHDRIRTVAWTNDLASVYSSIDVLAFPSYREGLPNVPLEAQACSIPVVGYEASGTVDAVRNGVTGRLVPVGDVTALSDALAELLDDATTAGEMGKRGKEWVGQAFRQDVVWSALRDCYETWIAAG